MASFTMIALQVRVGYAIYTNLAQKLQYLQKSCIEISATCFQKVTTVEPLGDGFQKSTMWSNGYKSTLENGHRWTIVMVQKKLKRKEKSMRY